MNDIERQIADATERLWRIQATYPGATANIETTTRLPADGDARPLEWNIFVFYGNDVFSGIGAATAAEALTTIERKLASSSAVAYPEAQPAVPA